MSPPPPSQAHTHLVTRAWVWSGAEVRGPLVEPRKQLSSPQSQLPYLNICDLGAGGTRACGSVRLSAAQDRATTASTPPNPPPPTPR